MEGMGTVKSLSVRLLSFLDRSIDLAVIICLSLHEMGDACIEK